MSLLQLRVPKLGVAIRPLSLNQAAAADGSIGTPHAIHSASSCRVRYVERVVRVSPLVIDEIVQPSHTVTRLAAVTLRDVARIRTQSFLILARPHACWEAPLGPANGLVVPGSRLQCGSWGLVCCVHQPWTAR